MKLGLVDKRSAGPKSKKSSGTRSTRSSFTPGGYLFEVALPRAIAIQARSERVHGRERASGSPDRLVKVKSLITICLEVAQRRPQCFHDRSTSQDSNDQVSLCKASRMRCRTCAPMPLPEVLDRDNNGVVALQAGRATERNFAALAINLKSYG